MDVNVNFPLSAADERFRTAILNILSIANARLDRIEAKLDLLKAVPGIDPAALAKLEADLNAQIDAETAKMKAAVQP
jgi:hypothetical protein